MLAHGRACAAGLCVRTCVRACVRMCVCVCVWVGECVHVCVCARARACGYLISKSSANEIELISGDGTVAVSAGGTEAAGRRCRHSNAMRACTDEQVSSSSCGLEAKVGGRIAGLRAAPGCGVPEEWREPA